VAAFAPRPAAGSALPCSSLLIALVEWGTRTGWISALTLPKPSDVLKTLGELYSSGMLSSTCPLAVPAGRRRGLGASVGISVGV
jgi:NitT/TauT family transport system permease protein